MIYVLWFPRHTIPGGDLPSQTIVFTITLGQGFPFPMDIAAAVVSNRFLSIWLRLLAYGCFPYIWLLHLAIVVPPSCMVAPPSNMVAPPTNMVAHPSYIWLRHLAIWLCLLTIWLHTLAIYMVAPPSNIMVVPQRRQYISYLAMFVPSRDMVALLCHTRHKKWDIKPFYLIPMLCCLAQNLRANKFSTTSSPRASSQKISTMSSPSSQQLSQQPADKLSMMSSPRASSWQIIHNKLSQQPKKAADQRLRKNAL